MGTYENLNFLGTHLKEKCSTLCYNDAKFKKNALI